MSIKCNPAMITPEGKAFIVGSGVKVDAGIVHKLEKDNLLCRVIPPIRGVVFAGNKTIVIWNFRDENGKWVKTSAVCAEGDTYCAEVGFMMAVSKFLFGSNWGLRKFVRNRLIENHKKPKKDKK